MELLAKMKVVFDAVAADEHLRKTAFENASKWLEDETLAPYRPYIRHLVESGAGDILLDSFWRMIPFGTGGRRGPVGAGPNRINPYTVALSVQGHCDYLRQVKKLDGDICVVIAFDVRQFYDLRGIYTGVTGILENLTSRDMAKMAAETYAANGVVAYVVGPLAPEKGGAVSDSYISTPELSFLIRELRAAGGINISASHNHPDDNGGKFYNGEGGQEIPPNDEALLSLVESVTAIKRMDYLDARAAGGIRFVPAALHRAYIEMNKTLCPSDSRSAKIAFTPLSGTGSSTVLPALNELGFDVCTVDAQLRPDGSFQQVRYRIGNPEVPESMDKLEVLAQREQCDVGFATDPDADRLGMIALNEDGRFTFISGNQIGVLLIESILQTMRRRGEMPPHPFFANTVVTTSLQRRIAASYGCQVVGDLMVGCKYMAEVIRSIDINGRYPSTGGETGCDTAQGTVADYVFSCEESHGYLVSPRVRDKDACGAAVHLAGLVSRLKDEKTTLSGMLDDIYRVYGYYANRQRSLVMEGIVGLERIARIQKTLRCNPPSEIAGRRVRQFTDFQVVGGPLKSATDAASRNVLLFELENDAGLPIRLVVRPSGTEPKTKIYVEVPSTAPLGGTLYDVSKDDLKRISARELDKLKQDADILADDVVAAFIRYCLGEEVLGDTYPEVPDAALLVSDLVPVDEKIRLFTEVLPNVLNRIKQGESIMVVRQWLWGELESLGDDPLGLINPAVTRWISSVTGERGCVDAAVLKDLFSMPPGSVENEVN